MTAQRGGVAGASRAPAQKFTSTTLPLEVVGFSPLERAEAHFRRRRGLDRGQ